ncbi:MAG TPA: hypothetical protein VFQ44_02020 [Streptosporangiaceae bacterium]|nr:hypothetical protein [Streptosporangiaceae bacterium]
MIGHELWRYWQWVGGNIGALPLEAAITAVTGAVSAVVFRRPVARLIRWCRSLASVRADIDRLNDLHQRTHQIMADLWQHHTRSEHPLAVRPDQREDHHGSTARR